VYNGVFTTSRNMLNPTYFWHSHRHGSMLTLGHRLMLTLEHGPMLTQTRGMPTRVHADTIPCWHWALCRPRLQFVFCVSSEMEIACVESCTVVPLFHCRTTLPAMLQGFRHAVVLENEAVLLNTVEAD
jgi:hypothetical protein